MGMCAAGVLVGSIFLGADTNYWAVETCLLEISVEQIGEITIRPGWYGRIPHNASFGFLDLAPSILHSNWFWDYIS